MSNPSSTEDRPVKRSRGRPRRGYSIQGSNTSQAPASDNLEDKHSVETDPASDDMIGRVVSGVIDCSFGAGYLLSVKVDDTNMHLRGLAFLPGQVTPITAENDVAPNAKMVERKDTPYPVVNEEGHLYAVSPSLGKSEKLVENKNDAPNLPDQGLHIGLQSGATAVSESQSASIPIPPTSRLPINDTDLPLGQKVMQDVNIEALNASEPVSANESQSASIPIPPASSMQINGTDLSLGKKVMQDINIETLNASEPVSATLPATEPVNLKPQVDDQVVCSDLITQNLFHDDVKSLDLGDSKTPKCSESEPQADACESTQINMSEKEVSSRQDVDISQDTELELATKISGGADTSHMDGLSTGEAATTTTTVPCSASESKPDSEVELSTKVSGEADTSSHMDGSSTSEAATTAMAVPSEPNSAAEETPPETIVHEDRSSLKAADTNSEKSIDKDGIQPSQP